MIKYLFLNSLYFIFVNNIIYFKYYNEPLGNIFLGQQINMYNT